MTRRTTTVQAIGVIATAIILASCAPAAQPTADESVPSETTTSAPPAETETEGDSDETQAADQPAWATPVTRPGELISTFMVGEIQVEAYQVGTSPAPEDGSSIDPDTYQPIIKAGDPLVFINYVVTNTGPDVPLSALLVEIDAKYEDWRFIGGMTGISRRVLYDEHGVSWNAVVPGRHTEHVLETGQSFCYATNFGYRPGVPLTFAGSYKPVDEADNLLHDQEVEGEGTAVLS